MVNKVSDTAMKKETLRGGCFEETGSHDEVGNTNTSEPVSSVEKDKNAKSAKKKYEGQIVVQILRIITITVFLGTTWHYTILQHIVNDFYKFLMSMCLFHSVYFETFFATFCYSVIIPIYPWSVDKFRILDSYKLHPSVKYEHTTVFKIVQDAVTYMGPLMLLDTFMVKKYGGVGIDPNMWEERRKSILQTTRVLPNDPPHLISIIWQLTASFIVYDALFFAIHLVLHKNFHLYKYIHKYHHDHDMVHSHVTNQLTIPERITLILSANFALKVFNSHPLTRTIFIPIFIWILVDNHSGYDMPFGLHRLVPFRIVGGSVKHFQHHSYGSRCYEPIFTYLDKIHEIFSEHFKTKC
ncbi:cholesterol 25-hydroxylase-like protein isoform X2 [Mya arenaria]|nr:cholesterol 25-hydroxylase-like protein isoform X2 [Mya arenaria]XP_052776807.1 cholesterol 25-hydroxylase-like protein isoform X2 [Mya arenaria]XP_052776808.1 cholesterol 25-hydroxylase-like protein isoform X2 [Mya arenaria]XP_052776809.1 cholesterol 25-hydroxylase-like protein isoform X2 [Mya arenaria]XP_052776810.1 cholesterol 25-hydroxylase-like protein isoform X2 [Mya arenaria]